MVESYYVRDIDPGIIYKIRLLLSEEDNWKKLLKVSSIDREVFEKYVANAGFRDEMIFARTVLDFCNDFYIKDFIFWLEKICLEEALLMLKNDEPLKIIEEPKQLIELIADQNEAIILSCKASGFPTPKYKWYREETALSVGPVLKISPITLKDVGFYYCEIYNFSRSGIKTFLRTSGTNIVIYTPQVNNIPQIICQSSSSTIKKLIPGTSFASNCEVKSNSPVTYQWYCNGIQLEGKRNSKLNTILQQDNNTFQKCCIECVISNKYGSVISNKVIFEMDYKDELYFAEDKFALLIGNSQYKYFNNLNQPTKDVYTLTKLLKSIDFKTLSFENLNRTEIIEAVKLFCSFLRPGVYGLVYIAGHGFEQFDQCYLLPIEAKHTIPKESICIDFILKRLQECNTAANVVLLDTCRILPKQYLKGKLNPGKIFLSNNKPLKNTIIGYATSFTYSCYEVKNTGIYVHYLKRYIKENISVSDMLLKVNGDIEKDANFNSLQYPSISGYIPQSLTDKINGNGEIFQNEQKRWKLLTSAPKELNFKYDDFDILVEFLNYEEFSNVLLVNLFIKKKLCHQEYEGHLDFPDMQSRFYEKNTVIDKQTKLCCSTKILKIQQQTSIKGRLIVIRKDDDKSFEESFCIPFPLAQNMQRYLHG